LDIAAICKSCGVDFVQEVDAHDLEASLEAIQKQFRLKAPQ